MRTAARRWWVLVLTIAVSGVLVTAAVPAVGDDAIGANGYVVVELNSPGAAKYTGGIKGIASTHPQNGRFDSTSPAFEAYKKHLDNEHANFRAALGRTAPQATIVREYYVTANAIAIELNGADPKDIGRLNGAKQVWDSGLFRPTMDQSVELVSVPWSGDGAARETAGSGVNVAVIDSGIVNSLIPGFHPFFLCKGVEFGGFYYSGVTGTPAIGIGQGNEPAPGAAYVSPHGTHVAGTVGGCVTTIIDGSVWNGTTLSGVAPGATLVDYNVFPGIGAGWVAFGGSAFSHDIAAAIEDAVLNGEDVINMSLGGGVQGPHDFLAEASNGAVAAGVVVVTSAGNEGPGEYTVGSPGSASDVIAVGATTNTRGMGVEIQVDGGDTYNAVPGEFPDFDGSTYAVIDWPGSDNQACTSDVADDSLSGEVVLISRGTCAFSQKMANAKAAGAGGAIVYNNVAGDPFGMGGTAGFDDQIPAVMVSDVDGAALEGIAPFSAAITSPIIVPTTPNELADFSSWGPAPFTGILKPDVVAPGVNILSSVFFGWELFNGTSMASPHVAGASAILLEQNPNWTPGQVKSALATTATDLGLPVWQQGSGLIDIEGALDTNAFFAPTNASFGVFEGKKPANGSVVIAIDTAATCVVQSVSGDAASFFEANVDGSNLIVDFTGDRDAPTGTHGGIVTVDCDGQDHSIPYLAVVDRKG